MFVKIFWLNCSKNSLGPEVTIFKNHFEIQTVSSGSWHNFFEDKEQGTNVEGVKEVCNRSVIYQPALAGARWLQTTPSQTSLEGVTYYFQN